MQVNRLAPQLFPTPGWRLHFHHLENWRQIRVLAAQAAQAGAWAVVAVGGDGTLNQASLALAGSPTRLGVIPAGTGNGYARALGIPLDASGACAVIKAGRTRRLDFASIDADRGYANMLGLGYDAWIAAKANRLRWMNRISGFARYLAAAFLCANHLRPQRLRLTLDQGRILEGRWLLVAAALSPQYGFGCTIAPDARMDDGLLDVVCVPPSGPLVFVRNCFRLFKRRPLLGAQFHRSRGLRIESLEKGPVALHLDGEPGGVTPVTVRVRKGVLRVLAP